MYGVHIDAGGVQAAIRQGGGIAILIVFFDRIGAIVAELKAIEADFVLGPADQSETAIAGTGDVFCVDFDVQVLEITVDPGSLAAVLCVDEDAVTALDVAQGVIRIAGLIPVVLFGGKGIVDEHPFERSGRRDRRWRSGGRGYGRLGGHRHERGDELGLQRAGVCGL